MKRFRLKRNSVQTKLNIALILIVTFVLTGFGVYDYIDTKTRMIEELDAAATSASKRLVESMSMAIWEMHTETGIAAAEAEMTDQRIAGIMVMEKNGEKPFLAVKRRPGSQEIVTFDGNMDGEFASLKMELVKENETLGSVILFVSYDQMHKKLKQSVFALFVQILVLDLILVVCMSVVVKKVVTGPFNKIVAWVRDIAEGEGDLTMRLKVQSNDEIGSLAGLFNRFIENLQQIIQNISRNAQQLNTASADLSSLSCQMLESSEQVSKRANAVATASDEMSGGMNSVAAASEQASNNLNIVASATEEMTATVSEIAKNSEKARLTTDDAVNRANSAHEQVDRLGASANQIGSVTEVITEISEQVNLLALNATIEAARAGEAGKGFAVVANEIKELAKQTAVATQKIRSHIDEVQTATSETVVEIKAITEVIDNVSKMVLTIAGAVEEQSASAQEIAGNLAQASQGIQHVNTSVNRSSAKAGEIALDIAEVNQSTQEVSSGSSQVNSSAAQLTGMANELLAQVSRFKV
jgi:methyl-accepting chemotaxis protein